MAAFPPTATFTPNNPLPFDGDSLSNIEAIYIAYFGRAGDPGGVNFWVGDFLAGGANQATLVNIAASFSVQQEAKDTYPLLANPLLAINNPALVTEFITQIYQNQFSRGPDAGGLAFWQNFLLGEIAAHPNNPIAIANAVGFLVLQITLGAQTADQVTLSAKVTAGDFLTTEFAGAGILFTSELPPGTPANDANNVAFLFAHEAVAAVGQGGTFLAVSEAATTAFVDNPPSGRTFELTVGQDSFHGTGRDIFDAPLGGQFGDQPTLTHFDNLTDTGVGTEFIGANDTFSQLPGYGPAVPDDAVTGGLVSHGAFFGSVLNASFNATENAPSIHGGSINYVSGVNIQGIQTWNINAEEPIFDLRHSGFIVITAGSGNGQNAISGLDFLNFNANSGQSSLLVGDNTEPVQTLVNTITVSNAVGNGHNGVDVDISALAFTGHDAINVVGNVVGGFPLDFLSTSLIIPDPIICECEERDDHKDGPITMTDSVDGSGDGSGDCDSVCVNWHDFYQDAYAIAAGASSGPLTRLSDPVTGAVSYTTWNVYSIGAWRVEPKINFGTWVLQDATGTKGGVNIIALGAEGSESPTNLTLHDDGSSTILFATDISDSNGSFDWQNLSDIDLRPTSGFVVLSGAEIGDLREHRWNGGSGGSGDFSNGLLASVNHAITIHGGQGNSFYDLTSLGSGAAQGSHIDGGHGTNGNSEVAFNNDVVTDGPVDLTHIQVLDDADDSQGGFINMANFPLEPLNVDYTLLAGGVVPAGYQLLQFLGAGGCTGTTLESDLTIINGPVNFAINAQDMADTGHNITIQEEQPNNINVLSHLKLFVSDGASPSGDSHSSPNVTFTHSVCEASAAPVSLGSVVSSEAVYDVPVFTVNNYSTVDIYLPSEFDGSNPHEHGAVGLGTSLFLIQPPLVVPDVNGVVAHVNFFDNPDDNGCGSGGSSPDNLYIGHTQTYDTTAVTHGAISYFAPEADLIGLIGTPTVIIDQFFPPQFKTVITDFGEGRFEIGATDTTDLVANNTSALVMDLPGTGGPGQPTFHSLENSTTPHGIFVVGSDFDNLLQGTSGPIHIRADNLEDPTENGAAYFGPVGNDDITGGSGHNNIFPEGGTDHVVLNGADSTVWFATYDIGYSGEQEFGVNPGHILIQAVTDVVDTPSDDTLIWSNNYGPGGGVLTIDNFILGTNGDEINISPTSWIAERDASDSGDFANGLVQSDGHTPIDLGEATYASIVVDTEINDADVILAVNRGFNSAADLEQALQNTNNFNFKLAPDGVHEGTVSDMLIAYDLTGGGINIADLRINAQNANNNITDTSDLHGGSLKVFDLIHLTDVVGVNNLAQHNIQFFVAV